MINAALSKCSPRYRVPIRVLLVADGIIHFAEAGNNGFSLSELIEKALLPSCAPWEDLIITTARRFDDEDRCASLSEFKFDNADQFDVDRYDQVWLFGYFNEDDDPCLFLTESELKVLSKFMNRGGGVFATGDHASLGFAMCSNIPRVRSMRRWCFSKCPGYMTPAPGVLITRNDTLRVGTDPGFQFNDQSDSIPQEIRPKFYPDQVGPLPHPLLVNGKFPITVLPDHLHEGECVIPTKLDETVTLGELSFDEYPKLPDKETRLVPEIVAIATSAGGHLVVDGKAVPPTEPRAFNIIVAYDGHQVQINKKRVGRVVVDSSFHHFLDINLKGTDSNDPGKIGFYDRLGNPTPEYQAIKQYFRNIVRWLCPPDRRSALYHMMLFNLRFRSPLVEELPFIIKPNSTDYLYVGAIVEKLITDEYSRAESLQCAQAVACELEYKVRVALFSLFDPWLPFELNQQLSNPLLDSSFVVRLILGAATLAIAREFPAKPSSAPEKFVEDEWLTSASAISRSVSDGLDQFRTVLTQLNQSIARLSEFLPVTSNAPVDE